MSEFINRWDDISNNRSLHWNEIKNDTKLKLEFVHFLKAPALPFGKGGYMDYVVKVIESDDVKLEPNTILRLGIAYRTWRTALWAMPIKMKRDILNLEFTTPDTNAVIEFIKHNQKSAEILTAEAKTCSTELSDAIEGIYKIPFSHYES